MYRRLFGFIILAGMMVLVPGCQCANKHTVSDEGWTRGERQEAKKMLNVKVMSEDAPLDITSDHITNVPPSLAMAKALQALNNYSRRDARSIGYDFPLATVFEPAVLTRQIVDGHIWYIGLLNFKSKLQAAYRQLKGVCPGIIVVDAEDESKDAVVRLRDNTGKPYHIVLHFRDTNFDENYIQRYLHYHGYEFSIVTDRSYVDDVTPEIEDGTWRLYYTATYNTRRFNYVGPGGWFFPEAKEVIIVNPETKKITEYKDPKKAPAWVDRIYSEKTMAEYIEAWGFNMENYHINSEKGRLVLDEQSLDCVMSADNTQLMYVGVMTSSQCDNSAVGVIVIPTRSLSGKFYPLYNKRPMATKFHAQQVINKAMAYRGWHVEDLTLHWIYGHLTWEGTYTVTVEFPEQFTGKNDGGATTGSTYMACVLLEADDDLNPSEVIWSESKQDAFDAYEHHLFKSQTSNVGSFALDEYSADGHISFIREQVENGQTTTYFKLKEQKFSNLTFRLSRESSYDRDSLDIVGTEVGDHVTFTYGDTKNSPTCFVKLLRNLNHPTYKTRTNP